MPNSSNEFAEKQIVLASASQAFEHARERLEVEPAEAGRTICQLTRDLWEVKRDSTIEMWDRVVESARSHPLIGLVHQDPLSWRAFTKPRGYQGDAQLLDVIYRKDYSEVWPGAVTPLGQLIFDYTIECKAPGSVRHRRTLLSGLIDETCSNHRLPHILSVACGHLREAHDCESVRGGRVGRFVGLDQDPDCIATVRRELSQYQVESVQGSIKILLGGPFTEERFDFIYAAGLYDYLEDRLARRVTERMFSMLNPGGRLLIANYLPDIDDVGFMEAYMGWRLIYRCPDELQALSEELTPAEVHSRHTFKDQNENIAYLDVRKTCAV